MNIEELQNFALGLPGTHESLPFDNNTLVFKVLNKMFLLAALESSPLRINFKALPADNIAYREKYAAVIPGYHSNKKHWSTASLDGSIPSEEVQAWIQDSYNLVVSKMTKKEKQELASFQ